ncbi:clasp N-terminal domain-containing protein [Amylostereum chailletii]|nr:clasp N-terminal domain-containing protein [Amylostereum chailletii]
MAPKVPEVIVCASEVDLQHELARIQTSLAVEETEESWDALSNALLRLTALCKGGACDHPSFLISGLRSMSRSITSAASSERSRLSAAAMECISIVASGLGGDFEPLVPLFLPTLLALCSRPNKVFVSRSKATIRTVIEQTQLPSVLPILVDALKDKSVSMRLIAVESICSCLNCLNPPDLEKESRARDIEKAIRQTATDASGDIRKISRNVFDAYKILLPNRVERYVLYRCFARIA